MKNKFFNNSVQEKLKLNDIEPKLQKKIIISDKILNPKTSFINTSKEPQRTTFSLYKNLNTQINTKITKKVIRDKETRVLSGYNSGNSGVNSSHGTERTGSAFYIKNKDSREISLKDSMRKDILKQADNNGTEILKSNFYFLIKLGQSPLLKINCMNLKITKTIKSPHLRTNSDIPAIFQSKNYFI